MPKTFLRSAVAVMATIGVGCAEPNHATREVALETAQLELREPATNAFTLLAEGTASRSLGVDHYELQRGASGWISHIRAVGTTGETQAEFDVSVLDENGIATADVEGARLTRIDMNYPSRGSRTLDLITDQLLEDSFIGASREQQLAIAVASDISEVGTRLANHETAPASDDEASPTPLFFAPVSGPGCFTQTKCKMPVLMCEDKCCAGWNYDPATGLPKGADCKTLKKDVLITTIKKYPCGACVGWD
jgi:hypothetical protein